MNFFKRAIISIKRRPGKTVILLLLVFILGNIISGAISIQQAVGNTEANLRRNLPAVATIEEDWEGAAAHERKTGEWPMIGWMTPEAIRQIGSLPYVKEFDFSASVYEIFSRELKRVNVESDENGNIDFESLGIEGLERLSLTGVENPEILDLNAGIIELVHGRHFTEQEMQNFNGSKSAAVISKEFADLNNLSVGSTFTLDNNVYDYHDNNATNEEIYKDENRFDSESYEFEVIGIFEPVAIPDTGNGWEDELREIQIQNRIYVPNIVAETAIKFTDNVRSEHSGTSSDNEINDIPYNNIVYLLNDPMELTDFTKAALELLPEFWIVNDLSNTFENISSSMETLQWLASLVLWIAIGASILILSLLVTLFLRDRKYEIGIYLALGEKKIKVITQIMLEVLATGIIAITLSLFTGSLIAGNISENMIRRDLIASQQGDLSDMTGFVSVGGSDALAWFSNGEMSVEEMLANYDLSVEATTIVLLYSVGVGTLLISTAAPILYIMRLNPKKIMM